ncbi:MAG: AbrB/MazE/SpoVT family DNA-binding domain-containing protein [Defluviitaleaceae bacterium]|nr:AbrB/MazE/SpoVT family DNA-binding domain-containing protein [Defluviitaleaceae bacterium]
MSNQNAKYTGAVKKVDELGRIIIPRVIREQKQIRPSDKFEFVMDGDVIMLVRHFDKCMACDDDTNIKRVHKTYLCEECREAVGKAL